MEMEIGRVDVWAATIEDRPGGLAEKLDALAQAGANLEFVIARRSHEKAGTGVVFVTPLKGAKLIRVAKEAGFEKSDALHSLRVSGADKPGIGARLTREMAEQGINLRGFSGAALGRKAVFHLAFDTSEDAGEASRHLKKIAPKL